jgi:hypothetical protein
MIWRKTRVELSSPIEVEQTGVLSQTPFWRWHVSVVVSYSKCAVRHGDKFGITCQMLEKGPRI